MSKPASLLLLLAALVVAAGGPIAKAAPAQALEALDRVELPGLPGDFGRFEADLRGNRLFLAMKGQPTLEVFDLRSGRLLKTADGLGAPQDLLYLPDADKLVVTQNRADDAARVLDATTYQTVRTYRHINGAESIGYDAVRKRLYVVATGRQPQQFRRRLVEIDPYTGKNYGVLNLAADKIGGLAPEQRGDKIYVNMTGKNEMAVVDKKTRSIIATWPIGTAQVGAPLAFDEAGRRLFVVTRNPALLLVLNADTGATVASFKAPAACDQLLFDETNRRVYALGGEGYIGVFAAKDRDHYEELAPVRSAPGANTGILIPELHRLYVAASSGGSAGKAALLSFNVLK